MNVPSVVAMSVESSAIVSEFWSAARSASSASGSFQWSRVKPCQVKLKRPLLSLNENRMMMKTGMKRYASASADQMPSPQVRILSQVCAFTAPPPSGSGRPGGGRTGRSRSGYRHQDERQRGRRRVVQDRQELVLDDVADH